MYSIAAVFVLAVALSGTVAGRKLRRDGPELTFEINKDTGLLEVDVMNSPGLVCHKEGSDEIAKVACGGEGTSSEASAEGMDPAPEFSVDMTCTGDEAKLSECGEPKIQQLSKCDKFVVVQCGGRRSLRWTI